jgi:hypothetical protein
MSTSSTTTLPSKQQQPFPQYTTWQLKKALHSLCQGSEHPEMDARHMFGHGVQDHQLSRLQTITATRILDVQAIMV